MIDARLIDEVASKLAGLIPGAQELRQDMEKNFRAVLQGAFTRLDLVTREEFDVQAELLARTRARLDALASQVAGLEAKLREKTTDS